jgi:hypothetical protein
MRILAIALAAFVLAGCAMMNKPTQEQIAAADYGLLPEDYKTVIQTYMPRILLDPYSAVFSHWRGPSRGYAYDQNGSYFGYRVCVEVNAKNRMGGYVGSQPYFFLLNNGRVMMIQGGYRYGTIGAEEISKICNF